MMKMHYDPEADAFAVQFAPKGAYVESEEVAPGVTLDFDADGQVIGIEVLGVRKRMAVPAMGDALPRAEKSAAE
jgi:uncharacterized protein YuzE